MQLSVTLQKFLPNRTFVKLIIASLLIGFLSAILAILLKHLTEHYENLLLDQTQSHTIYFFIFPFIGLTTIFFLRLYIFKKKANKGIKEIFESTQSLSRNLPLYKIPSHFINGFLTVIFGGSTGIEVSTVVATATLGSIAQQKELVLKNYKIELISAGIAAGITALFCSPLAGVLFVWEVIAKKTGKVFLMCVGLASTVATFTLWMMKEKSLFAPNVTIWHYHAIPYFILLGVLAGVHSVYLTKSVLFFKDWFSKFSISYYKILIGALALSIILFCVPALYGDGYHYMKSVLLAATMPLSLTLLMGLLGILILKPIITSITLASGGDGGVFAPSLFAGAALGYLIALLLNTYFDVNVIPLNFAIIGMAAVLSASIHAPLTALFVVCGMINDYSLMLPILMICIISKYTAKALYPYTVYTFTPIQKAG
jgi:CIC family chloride channel protein